MKMLKSAVSDTNQIAPFARLQNFCHSPSFKSEAGTDQKLELMCWYLDLLPISKVHYYKGLSLSSTTKCFFMFFLHLSSETPRLKKFSKPALDPFYTFLLHAFNLTTYCTEESYLELEKLELKISLEFST
jgi:hypothetical protein